MAAFPWASSKNIFLVELSTLGTVDHTDLREFSATERIRYKIVFLDFSDVKLLDLMYILLNF